MGAVDLTDMTRLEMEVLLQLMASRITHSSVTVAAALWPAAKAELGEDPVDMVDLILQDLSTRGLITYRQHSYYRLSDDGETTAERPNSSGAWGHFSHPSDIRLTTDGWEAVGYPIVHHEVGLGRRMIGSSMANHDSDSSRHPGDGTDFRNYRLTAKGDAIERMHITRHCDVYQDHAAIHAEQLQEWRVIHGLSGHPRRQAETSSRGGDQAGLGHLGGRQEPRPRDQSDDRPPVHRLDDGVEVGSQPGIPQQPSVSSPRRTGDLMEGRNHMTTTTPVDPPRDPLPADVAEASGDESFPILDALQAELDGRSAKQAAILDAAEAIAEIDTDLWTVMVDRAHDAGRGRALSEIEVEYLRFARVHGR